MKEYKIYTCGKMSGIPFEEQIGWRLKFEKALRGLLDGNCTVKFIHPPFYYNYEDEKHKTEKEVLEWEMTQLHDCDIVVVNLDKIDSTTGSHMELGAVQGINRFGGKHIFVVGFGSKNNLHPWIEETCLRIEDNIDDAADFVVNYLLV